MQHPEFKLSEDLLNRNRGKHIWKCGLLEMAELQPYRCMKCNLTIAELQQLGNTGVCSSEYRLARHGPDEESVTGRHQGGAHSADLASEPGDAVSGL